MNAVKALLAERPLCLHTLILTTIGIDNGPMNSSCFCRCVKVDELREIVRLTVTGDLQTLGRFEKRLHTVDTFLRGKHLHQSLAA